MEVRTVQTSHGAAPVRARWAGFSPERPLLLVIRGAFPSPASLQGLPDAFADVDVAFLDLPGMAQAPPFAQASLAAFADAFDQVIEQALPGRPVNLLGLSVGGLVAFAMRHPRRRAIVAVDPPLTTAGLWPLHDYLRQQAIADPALKSWIESVLGISDAGIAQRDYRALLDGLDIPTHVVLASDPLEPVRPVSRMPSLVSEAERRLYQAHPRVTGRIVPDTGHDIPFFGGLSLVRALRDMLGPAA